MTGVPDSAILGKCRRIFRELAKGGSRIAYGELADVLGVNKQNGLTKYLDALHDEEVGADWPDITVIAHRAKERYGHYVSRGAAARSLKFDAKNPKHVAEYKAELRNVYWVWGGNPDAALRNWLNDEI